MSNKTSDKNVAIEKNVLGAFVLSNRIEVISQEEFEDVKKAMQNILAEREQKDKQIQELEEELNGRTDNTYKLIEVTNLYLNSIPKQAVIDKIEEIKKDKDSKYYDKFLCERDIENVIEILQELLEGEK